jgi:hypothetical protein
MCFLKTFYPSNDILVEHPSSEAEPLKASNSLQKANQIQMLQRLENSIMGVNVEGFSKKMSSLFDVVLQNEKVIISLQNVFFCQK